MQISIEVKVAASIDRVWQAWTRPQDIQQWNFASDEWQCPDAQIDLKPGGRFSYRMEAKDGSMGFDFSGTFTKVTPHQSITFELGDGRPVVVEFETDRKTVTVRETFEAESENAAQQQKQGWQAILDNFARFVEGE
ncbi:MAG: SRPBCC domain-containing protein [Planctomycetota bacterium]|nr:SRPBCC domain-containing protein [Planctomycetota bacterium]